MLLVSGVALSALGLAGQLLFAVGGGTDPSAAGPRAGTEAVTRATSPSGVAVPAVVGLGRFAAAARLAAAGLVVGTTVERDSPVRAGVVIAVAPAEGRTLPRGTAVALVVASGRITVPDVVGASLTDAVAALARVGLAVTWNRVPSKGDGVLTMTPRPGSSVAQGSNVQLEVGGGGVRRPAPTKSRASEALATAPAPEVSAASPLVSPSPSPSPSDGATASPTSSP